MDSYFCEPYHRWEKGTIENRNGVIRYYFPKGIDFSKITEEQIKYVQDKIILKQRWFSDLEKYEMVEGDVISENRITNSQPTYYNNRPMKLLGFKTPKEVHDKLILNHTLDKSFAFAA